MYSKSLLIAIAAFAVTATGAQAYVGSKMLARAGLSAEQIDALEEARSLRVSGKTDAARDVLVEAGIDETALANIHRAAHEARQAMWAALQTGDFATFTEVIKGTPLADIVTTEADFELFREAHELRRSGAHEEAQEIFTDLGIPEMGGYQQGQGHRRPHAPFGTLSLEQRDALRAARQANDPATVRAILDEAGENDGWGRL